MNLIWLAHLGSVQKNFSKIYQTTLTRKKQHTSNRRPTIDKTSNKSYTKKKRIPGSSRFRYLLLLTFLATYCAHTVNMVLAEFEPSSQRSRRSQRSNASNHPAQDGEFVSLYNDGVRNSSYVSLNVLHFI